MTGGIWAAAVPLEAWQAGAGPAAATGEVLCRVQRDPHTTSMPLCGDLCVPWGGISAQPEALRTCFCFLSKEAECIQTLLVRFFASASFLRIGPHGVLPSSPAAKWVVTQNFVSPSGPNPSAIIPSMSPTLKLFL